MDTETSQTTPDAESINSLILAHQLWLKNKPGGSRADFSHQNLSSVVLTGLRLPRAKFSGASLLNATLDDGDFSECDFFVVDFTRASLVRANLYQADMRGAILSGTDLSFANLDQTDLRTGTLVTSGGDGQLAFVKSDLGSSVLGHAKLRGANQEQFFVRAEGAR